MGSAKAVSAWVDAPYWVSDSTRYSVCGQGSESACEMHGSRPVTSYEEVPSGSSATSSQSVAAVGSSAGTTRDCTT